VSRVAESIHQEAIFKASGKRVHEALTNPEQCTKVTQLSAAVQSGLTLGPKPTEISREVGGALEGQLLGAAPEIPSLMTRQAWRPARRSLHPTIPRRGALVMANIRVRAGADR
jgi:hypothetical protein